MNYAIMMTNNVYNSVEKQRRKQLPASAGRFIFELSECRQRFFEGIKTKKPGILTQLTLLIAWYNS